jgi:hypothetical protein
MTLRFQLGPTYEVRFGKKEEQTPEDIICVVTSMMSNTGLWSEVFYDEERNTICISKPTYKSKVSLFMFKDMLSRLADRISLELSMDKDPLPWNED